MPRNFLRSQRKELAYYGPLQKKLADQYSSLSVLLKSKICMTIHEAMSSLELGETIVSPPEPLVE